MSIKDVLRYSAIGLLFLLPMTAFVVTNSTYFPFIVGKAVFFRVLVGLAVACWLVLVMANDRYRPRRSWISGAVVLFILIIAVADFFGVNLTQSVWSNFERMEGLVALLYLLGFFVVAESVFNSEQLWWWFFHISIAVSFMVGFFALFGPYPPIDGGALGNSIYMAIYMLFNAFLAGMYLIRSWGKNFFISLIYIFLIFFNVIVMLLSETRGTALGFLISLGFMALLLAVLDKKRPTVRKWSAGVVVLSIIVAGIFSYALVSNNWYPDQAEQNGFVQAINNTPFVGTLATINLTDVNSATTRFYMWGISLEGASEKPLLGWGQDNFTYLFNEHYNPVLYDREAWFDRAHNTFFDWLTAGGVLGLLAYLAIFTALIWLIWRDPEDNWPLHEKVILTGAIVAYIIHSIFVFDNLISYFMFFSLLAYVSSRTSQRKDRFLEGLPSVSSVVGYSLAVALVVLVVSISLYASAYKPLVASRELINALRFSDASISYYEEGLDSFLRALEYSRNSTGMEEIREQIMLKTSDLLRNDVDESVVSEYMSLAEEEMSEHTQKYAHKTRPLMFWGQVLFETGQYKRAEDVLKTAKETSPHKQSVLFQLSAILIEQKKYDQAVEFSREAFELEQSYEEARIRYATVLRYAGREKEASEVLEPMGQSAIFNNRLLRPYLDNEEHEKVLEIIQQRIDILTKQVEEGNTSVVQDLIQERVSRAVVYEQMGQTKQAISLLEEIKADYPGISEDIDSFIENIEQGG